MGIAPYAKGGILPFIKAQFFGGAGGPSSGPGYARSTFPVGEGDLPAGALYFGPSWTCRGPLIRPGLRSLFRDQTRIQRLGSMA